MSAKTPPPRRGGTRMLCPAVDGREERRARCLT